MLQGLELWRRAYTRVTIRIGTCPDSWGVWFADDPRQIHWSRCLDEMAAAGYDLIELGPAGYLPSNTKVLQRELKSRGFEVAATFAMGQLDGDEHWPEFKTQILSTCRSL